MNHCPLIAIDYWQIDTDIVLHDVIIVTRKDVTKHRGVNRAPAGQSGKHWQSGLGNSSAYLALFEADPRQSRRL